MPLTVSNIKVYKAANNSDTSSNGGVITTNEIVDVVGALFPNVDNAERLSGSTKYRKMFFKLTNIDNASLISARVYQDADTQGDDIIYLAQGTSTDTQSSLSNSTQFYAAAPLNASIPAGTSVLTVAIPVAATNWFKTGQTARITNKVAGVDGGNEEFALITNVTASGNVITLTLSEPLSNLYSASNSRVSNVLAIGDLLATANNLQKTSVAGTFNLTKVTCNNLATVDASWTITFTSAIAFNVTSNVLASPTGGNIVNDTTINNPTFSKPYVEIDSDAFGGTFVTGDVISFTTNSATVPVWLKRVIPAGAAPTAVNKAYFVLDGGSV